MRWPVVSNDDTDISLVVCWLLNVSSTYQCISGTDLFILLDVHHTEREVADLTFCHTQSQYADTGPTSQSADPITPDSGKVVARLPTCK